MHQAKQAKVLASACSWDGGDPEHHLLPNSHDHVVAVGFLEADAVLAALGVQLQS